MDTPQSSSTMPTAAAPSVTIPRRRKRPRWLTVVSGLATILLVSQLGLFSPLFSFWVYPRLAEPGWHNITPRGRNVLYDFTTSVDDPSLMFACGASYSIFWHDPAPWRIGQLHFWRSTDSGAQWSFIAGPPLNGADRCAFDMPVGGHGAVFATLTNSSRTNSGVTWVSRDAGTTWQQIADQSSADATPNNFYTLQILAYRNGLLYGYHPDDGGPSADSLATSADDGAHWTSLPTIPSQLQNENWSSAADSSPVADYRSNHAWYRVLILGGPVSRTAPMLEHTTNDGRTWSAVGAIGSTPMVSVLMATTPLAPGRLCVAHESGDATQTSLLFASADGGVTWEASHMPASIHIVPDSIYGQFSETASSVQIDAHGDCYLGFHYDQARSATNDSQFDVLYLTPQQSTLQIIPLGSDDNAIGTATFVVPGSDGLPARVILSPQALLFTLAVALANVADETNSSEIEWTAIP